MKKTIKKKSVEKQVETPYTTNIKIFGKYYTATGNSAIEAIENLKIEGKSGGVCVLSVSKGDIKREKILNAGQVIRLFNQSPTMRQFALKNMKLLFGNL